MENLHSSPFQISRMCELYIVFVMLLNITRRYVVFPHLNLKFSKGGGVLVLVPFGKTPWFFLQIPKNI
jgi:hypothetical protein